MSEVKDWSATGSSNTSAVPDGYPIGTMLISELDNTGREVMAATKRLRDDLSGVTATTGSSGAYILAASAAVTAYTTGDSYRFRANHTNTTTATIDIDGVGVKNIYSNKSLAALTGGEIQSGGVYDITYDGTQFLLHSPMVDESNKATLAAGTIADGDIFPVYDLDATEDKSITWSEIKTAIDTNQPRQVGNAVLAPHENLVVKYVTAATVDIDADTVLVTNASGEQQVLTSVNLTADIEATVGANALDTGSESSGTATWYHIWVIAKDDGTTASLLSLATTIGGLSFPTDYTHAGYVGAVLNQTDNNFVNFYQKDNAVETTSLNFLSNGTATSATEININAPPTASRALINVLITSNDTGGGQYVGQVASDSTFNYAATFGSSRAGTIAIGTGIFWGSHEFSLFTAGKLWYKSSTNVRTTLTIRGWKY